MEGGNAGLSYWSQRLLLILLSSADSGPLAVQNTTEAEAESCGLGYSGHGGHKAEIRNILPGYILGNPQPSTGPQLPTGEGVLRVCRAPETQQH